MANKRSSGVESVSSLPLHLFVAISLLFASLAIYQFVARDIFSSSCCQGTGQTTDTQNQVPGNQYSKTIVESAHPPTLKETSPNEASTLLSPLSDIEQLDQWVQQLALSQASRDEKLLLWRESIQSLTAGTQEYSDFIVNTIFLHPLEETPLIVSHLELLFHQNPAKPFSEVLNAFNQMLVGTQIHLEMKASRSLPSESILEQSKTLYSELLLSNYYVDSEKTAQFYQGLILTKSPIIYSQGVSDIIDSTLSPDEKILLITSVMQQRDSQIEVLDTLYLKHQQGANIRLYTSAIKNAMSFNPQLLEEYSDQLLNEIEMLQ